MISPEELQQRVLKSLTRGKELATLWGVVQRVRELTADQRASVKELVKVISADPVLTSKVLRLVNSAAYGFSGRIANIDQAIVILGFRQLRDLCLGITVIKGAHDAQLVSNFDRISLWKHSLGTAVGTKLIQERLTGSKAADLFVAGLLCNIGRLILDQNFPKEFAEIVKLSREKNIRMLDAERQVLNVTHADIGGWAAATWGLDDTLVRCIKDHHGPSGNTNAAILNLAYVMTQIKGIGCPGDPILTLLIPGVLETLRMDEEKLVVLMHDLDAEFKLIEPMLAIMTE